MTRQLSIVKGPSKLGLAMSLIDDESDVRKQVRFEIELERHEAFSKDEDIVLVDAVVNSIRWDNHQNRTGWHLQGKTLSMRSAVESPLMPMSKDFTAWFDSQGRTGTMWLEV